MTLCEPEYLVNSCIMCSIFFSWILTDLILTVYAVLNQNELTLIEQGYKQGNSKQI